MNKLNNTSTSIEKYNDLSTIITSNTSVVNMVNGLELLKEADKKMVDGILTYTIIINNQIEKEYVKPVITDIIDTNLVEFVDGSVTIDGIIATNDKYIQ